MAQQPAEPHEDPTAVYEIRLQGTAPDSFRREFPTAAVLTTRTETVLFSRIEEPAELDAFIAHLLSLGLVLTAVHQIQLPVLRPDEAGTTGKEVDAS